MESIKNFVKEHPQWTSWIVLSIGMVLILVWSARDVGLLPGQWLALVVATVAVAGLAVWIIGWEDEEEPEEAAAETGIVEQMVSEPATTVAEVAEEIPADEEALADGGEDEDAPVDSE